MKRYFKRSAGLKQGWRSGLEKVTMVQLRNLKVNFRYEKLTISFLQPAKPRKYTPDFLLDNGIIIETKGRFETADRQKQLMVQEQHPDLDIRFVFSNSRQRISKKSKTTYGMWCQTHGFQYADKSVPFAWTQEPANKRSLLAIRKILSGTG